MRAVATETCASCGFDAADYTRDDLLGTLRALGPMWRTMTEGLSDSIVAARPAPGGGSVLEHATQSRDAVNDALHPIARPAALAAVVGDLEAAVAGLNATASAMTDDEWARHLSRIEHAVHVTTHHLRDAGRAVHALGAGAPQQRGAVVQVSASNGGVPKTALTSATIGPRGIVGDHQAERLHHGRPLQSLCLWSQEVIDALRDEGHPVYPGAAGENLTLAGIDWTTIRPGVRVAVGDAVLEISAFAAPCAKNAQWFSDGKFRRIDHNVAPGRSRAYAWVVAGGTVAPGAVVVVEP